MLFARLILAAFLAAFAAGDSAATITAEKDTTATGDRYVLYVVPEGGDADLTNAYDTVDIAVVPGPSGLLNFNATGYGLDGNLFGPDSDASFTNHLLSFPAGLISGRGLTVLDGSQQRPSDVSDADGMVKSIASLGSTEIADPGGFYFGNAILASGETGTASALFLRNGDIVGSTSITLGIPEPATLGLLVLGVVSLVGLRRRSKVQAR